MQCGHCVAVCPVKAVSIPEYDMADVAEYDKDSFTYTPECFLNAVKFRRSIRSYKDRRVEREQLLGLIEAGRYTATAVNTQSVSSVSYTHLGEKMEKDLTVPLWEKYLLTIEEAAVYFGIGENRLRELAALDMKREFTIDNGNRTLIKRKKFEGWLDEKKKISL